MFKPKKINNKTVYYSTLLDCEHFFTTRELVVKDNIIEIAKYLKIEKQNLIKPIQTHSANIEPVNENKKEYPDCDGLILNKKNYAIYLNFADCTPVILHDKKNNISAIAHAGWRGTAQKISAKTVLKMQKLFNSNPKDIIALIGPCISFKYFETYPEALEQLKKSINFPEKININEQEKFFKGNFANLKEINKQQLIKTGILEKNIDICPFCTIDDNDKFFSYRKENKTPLRHSAVVKIN